MRYLNFFILIAHVVLAIVVVPKVLINLSRALRGRIERHRHLAHRTLPLWVNISVTGVAVYSVLYQF